MHTEWGIVPKKNTGSIASERTRLLFAITSFFGRPNTTKLRKVCPIYVS
jgi:hypothetical protein